MSEWKQTFTKCFFVNNLKDYREESNNINYHLKYEVKNNTSEIQNLL